MAHSMTVAELKTAFLRDQIRILSTSLDPTEDWKDYGPEVESDLSDKAVGGVLQKVNSILGQHNRSVLSTQAVHHVSQQIERLYLNTIDPDLGEGSAQRHMVEKGADLTSPESIKRLPDEWMGSNVSAEAQERYMQLHKQLVLLDAERNKQRQRLAQYKQLKTLLEPFNEPRTNIQPNLVSKDSQLASELGRMRMLLAKVADRVNRVGQQRDGMPIEEPNSLEDMDTRLAKILDMT
ncbi:hypothetical protein D8B26_005716 [Coccidioides posadasii str. Silveira]|uniref:Uncharacterized protein n=1 Tax=Coccidioides posadasii (strain RMSCC 757 / Silveira) TaxID=443226 RepID=E9DAN6_COCPS|nr:conserved hypothetical protein [Coccidioides posadasii str. Silveira]QVM11064.1 hypothetical protein D8B26_005716 [Coccidioides posadasii str. Silveira]